MTGKAFRGLITQSQLEVVTVRTDKTYPALEFSIATPRQRRQQGGFQKVTVGAVCTSGVRTSETVDAGSVCDRRRPRSGCQQLVGLLQLWRQLVDQIDTRGHQFSAVLGQPAVPHLEGVERTPVIAISCPSQRLQQRRTLPQ